MHVFLYEWITGGGLIREPGQLPQSLLREGAAMATALAADFAKISGCRVSLLRDVRLDTLAFSGCEVVEIQSPSEWSEEFDRLAAAADWSLVVAPEFDRILERTIERLDAAGGRSLNASREFITLASNKQRTAERLREEGIAAPHGVIFAEGEAKLPADFAYPAVLKPVDGAGSQDLYIVASHRDEPPSYAWERRLEEFKPGRAASVAAICSEASTTMLPPCSQRLSDDARMTYLGGALIAEPALADRASQLARRALAAMPSARGFVGVDLVLGSSAHGDDDAVIEINPRVTTSYVGLRQAVDQNLAQMLLKAVNGEPVAITVRNSNIEFAADGATWVNRR
jgi:predicted ATP-grasp superfamily ATP-dependent carboligase